MDAGAGALADSTDWLPTALPSFAQLENALRCQVCKDLFNTPMITSCSHTFCSLCIRRCFADDGKCPTCRTNDSDSKLRRNWTAQEMVDVWQGTRQKALELASDAGESAQEPKTKKRKLEVPDSEGEDGIDDEDVRPRRKTRSSARQSKVQTRDPEVIELDETEQEEEAEPNDGLVACPMCSRRMKEEAVFPHLDHCTGPAESRSTRSSGRSLASIGSPHFVTQSALVSRASSTASNPQPTRLPQLTYSLFNDMKLRKKLKELGIPNHGPRSLLVRRHTEWINLWNANCDSTRPLTKRQLLSDLDNWERSQGGGRAQGSWARRAADGTAVMDKDFQRDGWAESNKGQYDDLIAQARSRIKREKEAAAAAENPPVTNNMKPKKVGPAQQEIGDDEQKPAVQDGMDQREEAEQKHLNNVSVEQQRPLNHQNNPTSPSPSTAEPNSSPGSTSTSQQPPSTDTVNTVRAKVDQTSLHSSQFDQTIAAAASSPTHQPQDPSVDDAVMTDAHPVSISTSADAPDAPAAPE